MGVSFFGASASPLNYGAPLTRNTGLLGMNKLTAGILIGAGVAGAAAAAYVPIKVGDTVQQQIEIAVASANAKQNSAGIDIKVLDYDKNAYSSSLVTRFTLSDPALKKADGTAPHIDIKHDISHGFNKEEFKSEVVVTDEMKKNLKEMEGKIPLHFDGFISAGKSVVNTYIEGFTLTPENGMVKVNHGIIRLN